MPDSRIYPPGSTRQEIKITIKVIVIFRSITRTEGYSYPKSKVLRPAFRLPSTNWR